MSSSKPLNLTTSKLFKEYRPTIFFVVRFFLVYVVLNVLYGLYVESFNDKPDSITVGVTRQISNILGKDVDYRILEDQPKVALLNNNETVVNVFEGCNGINTMIVFVSFLIAFGPFIKPMMWFIPLGLLVIHLFNLARLGLLFYVAENYQQYFYYVHKYAFTAIIYVVIFVLWLIWILKYGIKKPNAPSSSVSGI